MHPRPKWRHCVRGAATMTWGMSAAILVILVSGGFKSSLSFETAVILSYPNRRKPLRTQMAHSQCERDERRREQQSSACCVDGAHIRTVKGPHDWRADEQ